MKIIPSSRWGKLRLLLIVGILFGLSVYFFIVPLYWYALYHPLEGDIIFQSLPRNDLVNAIEGATHSPYSHCGVVFKKEDAWYVKEAIGPVKDTRLYLWIIRGRGGTFAVYRLKGKYRQHIPEFIAALDTYQGRPYDIQYTFDDEYIYCSELIYKAFKDASGIALGRVVTLGDLDWEPYRKTISLVAGGTVPTDRMMITPRHLSEAEELEKVYSNGI